MKGCVISGHRGTKLDHFLLTPMPSNTKTLLFLRGQFAVVPEFHFSSLPHSKLEGPCTSNPCLHVNVQELPDFTGKLFLQDDDICPLLGSGKSSMSQVIPRGKQNYQYQSSFHSHLEVPFNFLERPFLFLHRRAERRSGKMVNMLDCGLSVWVKP